MAQINFDDAVIAALRLPENRERALFTDRRAKGLQLVVRWSDRRGGVLQHAWFYRYTLPTGFRSVVKVGDWPQLTCSAALQEASTLRALSASGVDPRAAVLRGRAMAIDVAVVDAAGVVPRLRFENVMDQLRDSWGATGRDAATVAKYHRDLELYALPHFRGRDIRSITGNEWDELVQRLANVDKKPGAASNLHKAGRRLFSFAVDRELVQYNPLVQRKRSLGAARLVPDDRYLDAAGVHAFMQGIDAQPMAEWVRVNLRLMLMVGVRVEEWQRVRIGWLKMKLMRIEHPAAAMKNRRDAWTHLPDAAVRVLLDWLKQLKARFGPLQADWYLFPDADNPALPVRGHLSDHTRHFAWLDFSPKMLRKTISTHLQRQGCPPVVLRAIRNQTVAQGVEAHYDFDDLFHLKKQWIDKWCALLERARHDAAVLLTDRDSALDQALVGEVDELFKD